MEDAKFNRITIITIISMIMVRHCSWFTMTQEHRPSEDPSRVPVLSVGELSERLAAAFSESELLWTGMRVGDGGGSSSPRLSRARDPLITGPTTTHQAQQVFRVIGRKSR